ncbi:hypothetical protein G6F42_012173 [Rhizopus arrhizus]|nr:hypothetical protein G6F42_012173 [Rhizopus arrhizus]
MHHSLFDSPSFLQKILKKKSYNRPLYTSDIVAEVGPWKKQFQTATKVAQAAYSNKKPKTYNIRQPELSPSTSTITTSSLLSDSAIIIPTPSCSTPSQHHHQTPAPAPPSRKRPLSSEILIKIMDQKLKQQQQPLMAPIMTKSTSASTKK